MSSIEIRRHPQQRGQTHQTDSTGAPVVQGEADNTRQPPPVADNTPAAPGQVYYSVSRTSRMSTFSALAASRKGNSR